MKTSASKQLSSRIILFQRFWLVQLGVAPAGSNVQSGRESRFPLVLVNRVKVIILGIGEELPSAMLIARAPPGADSKVKLILSENFTEICHVLPSVRVFRVTTRLTVYRAPYIEYVIRTGRFQHRLIFEAF